ncbi:unnamed protein product [Lota lota]
MSAGPAWRMPMAPSSALPPSLASSEQRAVGSLAMIDGIQAVHCDPAKAHTEANTLTQNCSGVHKLAGSVELAMLRKAYLKERSAIDVKKEAVPREEEQFSEEGVDRAEARRAFQMERENIMQETDAFKTKRS